jgi:hypothetical protein
MRIVATLLVALITSVEAAPLLESRHESDIQDDGLRDAGGVTATNHTSFAVLFLICMSLLSFLIGTYATK